MIAKIAVSAANFAIDKPYSYRIPEGMTVLPGQRVQLPFGRANNRTEGVVLAVETGDESGLKPIDCCLDEEPLLTDKQLRLAAFLRERYFCTFYDGIRCMLPAGLWFRRSNTFSLTEDKTWKEKTIRKEHALEILTLLENLGGQAEESELRNLIAGEEILQDVLSYLLRKKWVSSQTDFQRKTGDKTEKIAIERTLSALERFHVKGIRTTIPFCKAVLHNETYRNGDFDTSFIETRLHSTVWREPHEELLAALFAVYTYTHENTPEIGPDTQIDPWVLNKRIRNL